MRSAAAMSSVLMVSSAMVRRPSVIRSLRCSCSRRWRTVPSMTVSPTWATTPPSTVGSTMTLTSTCLPVALAERRGQPLALVVVERDGASAPRPPPCWRSAAACSTKRSMIAGSSRARPAPTTNDDQGDGGRRAPCRRAGPRRSAWRRSAGRRGSVSVVAQLVGCPRGRGRSGTARPRPRRACPRPRRPRTARRRRPRSRSSAISSVAGSRPG